MDLLKKTKQICKLYDIKPTRSKGQNFLVNSEIYNQIIEIADINKDDNVLEVGPGLGFLSFKLAERVRNVVSVELDDNLANVLQERAVNEKVKNFRVINADALKVDISSIFEDKFKIVANIPYNITSVLLRKIFSYDNLPQSITFLVQKEVAQRIVADAGNMNMLALSVQYYSDAKIEKIVKPGNFWPKPKIDSAIINIRIKDNTSNMDAESFFSFAKNGFSSKRKMLKNNLVKKYDIESEVIFEVLEKLNLNKKVRAQELSLEEWMDLYLLLNKKIKIA